MGDLILTNLIMVTTFFACEIWDYMLQNAHTTPNMCTCTPYVAAYVPREFVKTWTGASAK